MSWMLAAAGGQARILLLFLMCWLYFVFFFHSRRSCLGNGFLFFLSSYFDCAIDFCATASIGGCSLISSPLLSLTISKFCFGFRGVWMQDKTKTNPIYGWKLSLMGWKWCLKSLLRTYAFRKLPLQHCMYVHTLPLTFCDYIVGCRFSCISFLVFMFSSFHFAVRRIRESCNVE